MSNDDGTTTGHTAHTPDYFTQKKGEGGGTVSHLKPRPGEKVLLA